MWQSPNNTRITVQSETTTLTQDEMYLLGQRTRHDVHLDRAHFVEHFSRIVENKGTPPSSQNASDFYLACACAHASTKGLAIFEHDYLSMALGKVRTMGQSASFVDEVQQQTRYRLLVASSPDTLPRISEYAGQGALLTWVRVITMRVAINHLAKHVKDTDLDSGSFDEFNLTPANVELAFLKQRYAQEFNDAMLQAFRALLARDRTLLRLCFIDGLSIDEIGVLYSVHRATAARWLVSAREKVFDKVHRLLELSLKTSLSPQEFDSIIRVVRSNLDVSISGLLRSQTVISAAES